MGSGARGRVLNLLFVLPIFAILISGCGDGSSTAASGGVSSDKTGSSLSTSAHTRTTAAPQSRPLSKAQLIARADAICKRANHEIAATKPKSASKEEILRVVPISEAVEMRAAAELDGLTAPASVSRVWSQVVHDRHVLAEQLASLIPAEKANDQAGITRLTQAKKTLHASLAVAAQGVGVKDCGDVGVSKSSGLPKSGKG
jgi:hypothetical protein